MAKKKAAASAPPAAPPVIHEAIRLPNGSVQRGGVLTEEQAIAQRQAGDDVVVCGADQKANRRLAGYIERTANGSAKACFPHASAGANALPHFQPDPRPPDGHTFYETRRRKAL
jgi:hypothetical protein